MAPLSTQVIQEEVLKYGKKYSSKANITTTEEDWFHLSHFYDDITLQPVAS